LNVAGSRIIDATQGRSHAIVADVGQQLRLLLTRADERGGSELTARVLFNRGRAPAAAASKFPEPQANKESMRA